MVDRSVLYKYINPNLIAVTTEGPDNIHKCESFTAETVTSQLFIFASPVILNVYLVDVVSGTVVFAMNHRRVKGPIQIVHSENWLVYSFYNEKIRRNEISECTSLNLLTRDVSD